MTPKTSLALRKLCAFISVLLASGDFRAMADQPFFPDGANYDATTGDVEISGNFVTAWVGEPQIYSLDFARMALVRGLCDRGAIHGEINQSTHSVAHFGLNAALSLDDMAQPTSFQGSPANLPLFSRL